MTPAQGPIGRAGLIDFTVRIKGISTMSQTTTQFKEARRGRGLVAVALLIALAAIDRGLSALWPATYGQYQPLAAITVTAMPLLAGYLILRG